MHRLALLVGGVVAVAAGLALGPMTGVSEPADSVVCPTIADLSILPGWSTSTAVAINDSGQIVGVRSTSDGGRHSFLWKEGRATNLGTLGGKNSSASAINNGGEIVGSSETAKGKTHAFLWHSGKMSDLGTLTGGTSSEALALNERGQVVGWSTVASGDRHVFLWQAGKMSDLGTLGETTTKGDAHVAINDLGEIVGSQAVIWQRGKLIHLGNLGGGPLDNYAAAINEHAQIVGFSATRNSRIHASLWQNTKARDLGTLPGGDQSRAAAINESGHVVGWSDTGREPGTSTHAFLWRNGAMLDLGTLRTDLYSDAVAINDNGQIIGSSSSSVFGTHRAVLWTLRSTSGSQCRTAKPWESGDSVVVHKNSIAVIGTIDDLRADAGRAIVRVPYAGPDSSLGGHCVDVFVWDRSKGKIVTIFDHRTCNGAVSLQSFGGVVLAGDKAAWLEMSGGNILESYVYVRSLASGRRSQAAAEFAGGEGAYGKIVAEVAGDGGLLVYRDVTRCAPESAASPGDVPCPTGVAPYSTVSTEVRLAIPARRVIASSDHDLTVLAVGGGHVVVRENAGSVIVLAPKRSSTGLRRYRGFSAEHLTATYPYKPGNVLGAATDGRTLAVLRKGTLDLMALPGSHGAPGTRTLPVTATELSDLDGQTAVYLRRNAVHVLNLTTGRSILVARPTAGPVTAQLEPDGLYIAAGRTLTFAPRNQLEQRLDQR